MYHHHVLIVEDEKVQAEILAEILTKEGVDVVSISDPFRALDLAKKESFDLVVTDLKMPKMDGLDFLKRIKQVNPAVTVVVMTAYGTIETAVQAMREGAYDYVSKPFSKEAFVITVKRAFRNIEIQQENRYLRGELNLKHQSERLIGESPAMQTVLKRIGRVAGDDKATVLITGETGTGKDLVARTIHDGSARREYPFVAVNCAAIPEGLLESEFFGHEKGAFTGAIASRTGRFELADRGTLFLDEVAELNANLQGKLLRVIETREFERVGGGKTIRVNVRIIAATNKDLEEEVQAGRFRSDLYYRLNVVPIHLPPLREHPEDIPLLVTHFLEKFYREGRKEVGISPEALQMLMHYHYPGNVRELENLLERALILSDGNRITPDELYLPFKRRDSSPPLEKSFKEKGRQAAETVEKNAILDALQKNQWNRSRVAEILGIDYKTLRLKIKKYHLDQEPDQKS